MTAGPTPNNERRWVCVYRDPTCGANLPCGHGCGYDERQVCPESPCSATKKAHPPTTDQPTPADPIHGKYATYVNHRCRCAQCRQAWKTYNLKRRAERRVLMAADPTVAPHGLDTTYTNWGCRCRPCTDAHREANYARNVRRAGASA